MTEKSLCEKQMLHDYGEITNGMLVEMPWTSTFQRKQNKTKRTTEIEEEKEHENKRRKTCLRLAFALAVINEQNYSV